MADKWTGVIKGTNRGLVILDLDTNGDDISGQVTVFDVTGQDLKAGVRGKLRKRNLTAKLENFQPSGDGNPSSGTIEATLSEDGQEIAGTWKTDAGTAGDIILYRFLTPSAQNALTEPKLTLETREIPVRFCTLNLKTVTEILTTVDRVCRSLRQGRESQVAAPIYAITYDAGESVRTYVLSEVLDKLRTAQTVSYIGVEFTDNQRAQKLNINFSYQPSLGTVAANSVSFSSTDRDAVTMVAEMLRGMLSKARNYNWWCQRRWFEAAVQLLAVVNIFWLSYLVAKKISSIVGGTEISTYGFIAALIVFSNFWTYLSSYLFSLLYKYYPVVEIVNRPRSKFLPNLIVGVFGSIVTTAVIRTLQLIWEFLVGH